MQYEPTEQDLEAHRPAAAEVLRLLSIMTRLRADCPWDREQTLESLRPYLLEETHEVLEAIDNGDERGHLEELGDLLLQIVFQAELAREEGRFGLAEVAHGISEKLLFRHPHVFGDLEAEDAKAAYQSWEKVKAAEKKLAGRPKKSVIDGVPRAAPSLLRAERIGEKASHTGFDWPDVGSVREKVNEELDELDAAIREKDQEKIFVELGDVLLTLASLGRFIGVHAEDALRESTERFTERFKALEADLAASGKTPRDLDLVALEAKWQETKERLSARQDEDPVPDSDAT